MRDISLPANRDFNRITSFRISTNGTTDGVPLVRLTIAQEVIPTKERIYRDRGFWSYVGDVFTVIIAVAITRRVRDRGTNAYVSRTFAHGHPNSNTVINVFLIQHYSSQRITARIFNDQRIANLSTCLERH